ncbi:DUF2577 domain-containing protein [Peptoanaerobacter stomatis]|uniref:DUF2577 domain-containing protein n=1 Tax=Peptoanaerobacter stomatis TaxID=796937 RepID=G9XBC5_9FIRM|nr:DUF2577 domain-containing protein [Peptoanaerobacter stomatis]EHL19776.1 hypothetical protein HMPREF9628_01292 [Peptoanaerobacter stomatis]
MSLVSKIAKISENANHSSAPVNIVYGKVISAKPLKIQTEQKEILDEDFLILTDSVRDYKTQISFDNPDIKQVFTTWDMPEKTESSPSKIAFKTIIKHDITVYNALKVGEGVILIRVQGGQEFIVLGRIDKR